MCDFLGDSSEGCLGSAVIRWGLSLAATAAACLPKEGRGGEREAERSQGSAEAQGEEA